MVEGLRKLKVTGESTGKVGRMNEREEREAETEGGEQIQSSGGDKIEVTCRRAEEKVTDSLSRSPPPTPRLLTATVQYSALRYSRLRWQRANGFHRLPSDDYLPSSYIYASS